MLQNQLVIMQCLQVLVGRNANLAAQIKLTEKRVDEPRKPAKPKDEEIPW